MQDLKVKTSAGCIKHQFDAIGDLLLGSVGPLLVGDSCEPWQTLDDKPVLIIAILDPIAEFCVDSYLGGDLLLEPNVMIFKVGHPVLVMTYLLLNLRQLTVGAQIDATQQSFGLVENMKHVVKPRHRGKMNAIGLKVLAREAGQKMEIQWRLGRED